MKPLLVALSALWLSACSIATPIVDLKSHPDPQKYQADLIECAVLSDQGVMKTVETNKIMLTETAKGGAISGASAALLGPVTGSVITDAVAGAGAGALVSVYMAPLRSEEFKQRFLARCLENRGHKIVNRHEMYLTPSRWCSNFALMGIEIDGKKCEISEKERYKSLGIEWPYKN